MENIHWPARWQPCLSDLVIVRIRPSGIMANSRAAFASSNGLDQKHNWRRDLIRLGDKLFGKRESENVKLAELGEARTSSDGLLQNDDDDMVQLIASYHRRSALPRGVRYDPPRRVTCQIDQYIEVA